MSGQVVFDDNYFRRKADEEKVWKYIERGSDLVLLSPRRAGKTSLLRYLERNPKDGYVFLYVMVQSCNTEHEFYKQVLEALYSTDFVSNLEKIKKNAAEWVASVFSKIDKISIIGGVIKLRSPEEELTYQDLIEAVTKLQLDEKLIIVLDEYPDVLEKINEKEGIDAATKFLTSTRALTQDIGFTSQAQLIITGSIGLDTLIAKMKCTNLINATDKLQLSALTKEEAYKFVEFLIEKNNSSMRLTEEVVEYLLQKVDWLMPYYIEILWERLDDICSDNRVVEPDKGTVDDAFEELFNQIYRPTFNHWVERLKRLETLEASFAKEVLNMLANDTEVAFSSCVNLSRSEKYRSIDAQYVMDCLKCDGYIHEPNSSALTSKTIKFTSPILKEWWKGYANRTL